MNINDYRRAMDRIVPDAALKERIMNQNNTKKKYTPARRVLTVALAAALTIACLFTVAFAASPELRTAVLSFFHMEEREQVPNSSAKPEGPDISKADIGELVKAQYIKMDKYYSLSGDLLTDLTWSEDHRTLEDAKFWEIKDNELVPVEIDLHTQQMDVTYGGVRYRGELYWYIRDGVLYPFKGTPLGVDTQPEDQWYVRAFSGRTDALLLCVSQGRQMEYTETALLYHLDTGETEELFAGVDPAILTDSDGSIWSPNANRALITGRASAQYPNGREWLYDRETRTLTDVSTLGGAGAEFGIFVDDDTLVLRVYTYTPDYDCEAVASWVYDIPTGRAVQTLKESPIYNEQDEDPYGIIPFYGGWAMEIGQDGSACLINLVTGERTVLENFTFQKNMDFWLNPSGSKLLYYAKDPETGGFGISQLGVIDLEEMTFIAFDREGYENLHEGGIVWENDNTISIEASSLDGETQYLLLYQF